MERIFSWARSKSRSHSDFSGNFGLSRILGCSEHFWRFDTDGALCPAGGFVAAGGIIITEALGPEIMTQLEIVVLSEAVDAMV